MSRFFLIFLCSFNLVANAFCSEKQEIFCTLQGISLVTKMGQNRDLQPGVSIDSTLQPDQKDHKLLKILAKEIGRPLTLSKLEHLKSTVASYFKKKWNMIVSVIIPPQDISKGLLQIVVMQGMIDEITLKGNRWTSDHWLLSGAAIRKGQIIRLNRLERNLAWLNRNPFRRTDLLLRSGKQRGTTDVDLITHERFPLRVYGGVDNTGVPFTAYTRWFTGFNAGNLWGWDHQLSYQFTTASDIHTFSAHSGNYIIPFPWRHEFYMYGGWSQTQGDLPQDLQEKGTNWQISGRYLIPINPIYGNLLQEVTVGYDFKRMNNGLIFGDISFANTNADINQFMVAYYIDIHRAHFKISLNCEIFAAPFKLTPYQSTERYQAIRPFAKDKYAYGRARFSHWQFLPMGFSLKSSLVGQGTAWNLMPSEQYGIGGYDTVRGYDERAFNADNAFLASLEICTPETPLFDWRKCNPAQEKLKFLTFIDYGWGQLHKPDMGEKSTAWLLGVGPGIRYSYSTYITFRGDLGFPLHKTGIGRHGIHFHIGGILSF